MTSGTFGTTPASSSPPGCPLGSCLLSSTTHTRRINRVSSRAEARNRRDGYVTKFYFYIFTFIFYFFFSQFSERNVTVHDDNCCTKCNDFATRHRS